VEGWFGGAVGGLGWDERYGMGVGVVGVGYGIEG
jgi:hypothetical protein